MDSNAVDLYDRDRHPSGIENRALFLLLQMSGMNFIFDECEAWNGAAMRLENWEFQWLVRDCGVFSTRPNEK